MELELQREYFPDGTNGIMRKDGQVLCATIELPWKDNAHNVSCVPEGRYPLVKQYSQKFGWHFQVKDVLNRDLIMIHPANDALKELEGCIAPVTTITGHGKGDSSRPMLEKLKSIVYPALDSGEKAFLTIKKRV